jgi:hypothetical protein
MPCAHAAFLGCAQPPPADDLCMDRWCDSSTGAACIEGVCTCPGGQRACDGWCFDFDNDPRNCGACQNRVSLGLSTADGSAPRGSASRGSARRARAPWGSATTARPSRTSASTSRPAPFTAASAITSALMACRVLAGSVHALPASLSAATSSLRVSTSRRIGTTAATVASG